ncbi:MAG: DUF1775 domain-containing protein [Gemmatimonadota bacterium]
MPRPWVTCPTEAALRRLAAAAFALLVASASPASLLAHAVVHPQRSVPGAYERYALRVPNERSVPTVRVEIAFPAAVRVVSFAEVPGWTLRVVQDEAGRVSGAVWTGEIGVERFVELPFVAVNPREAARLEWRVEQTYANGERVSWSGPEGSESRPPSPRSAGRAAASPHRSYSPDWRCCSRS